MGHVMRSIRVVFDKTILLTAIVLVSVLSIIAYGYEFEMRDTIIFNYANGIHINDSGTKTMVSLTGASPTVDFSLTIGKCEAMCGGGCYTVLNAPGPFWILHDYKDSMYLYSDSLYLDTISFYKSVNNGTSGWEWEVPPNIQTGFTPLFLIIQTSQKYYAILVIRSIFYASSGSCINPGDCCGYSPIKARAAIDVQTRGDLYFTVPMTIVRPLSRRHIQPLISNTRQVDILGRTLRYNPRGYIFKKCGKSLIRVR